ncbi:MAG: glycosyltransferase [Bryobacteraceae bacterium]
MVIVSYNCAGALRRCLAALEKANNRENLEVVVVDNGSGDESPQLEQEFPWTTFLRLPRNFGLTRARNIGSRTASGDFFLHLDPHVEVRPDTVSALAAALDAQTDAAAVTALLLNPDGTVATRLYPLPSSADLYRIWREGIWPPARPVSPDEPTAAEWIPGGATLVRAVNLRGMNYFDERYAQFWADLDLCLQVRRFGKKHFVIPAAQAVLHPDDGSPLPADLRGHLSADEALGAASYIGKHQGWFAGLRFHLSAALASTGLLLLAFLRARDIRFHFSRTAAILTGQRLDGTN